MAQQDTTAAEVEEQLEKAFEEVDTEDAGADTELLSQFLEDLAMNPVNLNRAGLDDLLQVPGINLKTARAILDYRKIQPFEQKRDLLQVRGIGEATYQRMSPYVTVGGSAARFRDMYMRPEYWLGGKKIDFMTRYQQDIEQKRGYELNPEEGGYLGSPGKYYQRLKLMSNHLSINLTQEKDPGEPMEGVTGFDYYSGHIAFRKNGKLNDLVIGDYSLGFGQGLVLWSGGSFGKGREVTGTVSKNERGISPYSSAQETNFYRGIAASYGEKVEVTAFYSSRPRTASVLDDNVMRFPSSSGLHRTVSERERKNNITQTTTGGRIRVDSPVGLIGATGYYNKFSHYIGKGSAFYNLYDFEGKDHAVLGLDYRSLIGSAFIFGEIARSQNGGMGAITGVEAPIGDDTEISVAYRNYSRDFQSFLGSGFGEGSSVQNQEGFYVGLRHDLTDRISFSTYFDQYKFPAPRFGTTQATEGIDILALAETEFNSGVKAYVLFRSEIQDEEYIFVDDAGYERLLLGKNNRSSIRLNLEYQVSQSARLRSRLEFVQSQKAGEQKESGFLIYQDLMLNLSHKLRFDTRITLFDTDSFDSRVYQFESDLLYVMSNTMLSGRGQRWYFMLKYNAFDRLDLWLKYGVTGYEDVHVISSGLNEIQGNRRSSIGVQARIQL